MKTLNFNIEQSKVQNLFNIFVQNIYKRKSSSMCNKKQLTKTYDWVKLSHDLASFNKRQKLARESYQISYQ